MAVSYGRKRKAPKRKASKTAKAKGVSLTGLNKRQQAAMKRHSVHHTAKHIRSMVSAMKKGSTFGAAHKSAMSKVGK